MANLITCGFARVTVKVILKKYANSSGQVSLTDPDLLVRSYNMQFAGYPQMEVNGNPKYMAGKFKDLNSVFSRKWRGQIKPKDHGEAFSFENWKKLPSTQKYKHSLPDCNACHLSFPLFDSSFPVRSCVAKRKQKDRQTLTCTIEASETDLSSPPTKVAKKLGHDIVTLLSPICENATGMALSKVLALTPNSGIAERKNRAQQKDERRKRMRNVKEKVELEFHKHDSNLALQKRLSFRKYNKIRLTESFESVEQATKRTKSKNQKITSKIHGSTKENLRLDDDTILAETREWSEDEVVNWTELANRYGVTGGNRGQIVKEYLTNRGVPAAQIKQWNLVRRAKLKLPGGEIGFPTHLTISAQKTELQIKIESGDILIGDILPPVQFIKYSIDRNTMSIVETQITIQGRKVPLYDIRKKVLKYHEKLGLLRITEITKIPQLATEDLNQSLHVRKISMGHNGNGNASTML